jgi:hypothetical protein
MRCPAVYLYRRQYERSSHSIAKRTMATRCSTEAMEHRLQHGRPAGTINTRAVQRIDTLDAITNDRYGWDRMCLRVADVHCALLTFSRLRLGSGRNRTGGNSGSGSRPQPASPYRQALLSGPLRLLRFSRDKIYFSIIPLSSFFIERCGRTLQEVDLLTAVICFFSPKKD